MPSKKKQSVAVQIIDDDKGTPGLSDKHAFQTSSTNDNIVNDVTETKEKKTTEKKARKPRIVKVLDKYYSNSSIIEIGIDEAGRGPMLGRVYTAAVVLPKDDSFDHSLMKDSKKFTSEKKINEAAEYIKKHAIAWAIKYSSEDVIDSVNIRNATHKAMHNAALEVINKMEREYYDYHLLVDGNDFKPLMILNDDSGLNQVPHTTIEGGDNKYSAIAAASILAKVTRDEYIRDLCEKHPYLNEYYDLENNKGYGTKSHMDGIMQYGISKFHRKSFGICKEAKELEL